METKFTTNAVAFCLLTLLVSTATSGQEKAKPKQPSPLTEEKLREFERNRVPPPPRPGFYIAPIEGSLLFKVSLGDGSGNSVEGMFSQPQIEVFDAVLQAAKAFALTDEAVGTNAPIITRLMEQHEWSLFVDVSKQGTQSRFYLSLITPKGKMTIPAGEITRGSKKEPSALLLDIASRVQEAKAGTKPQR